MQASIETRMFPLLLVVDVVTSGFFVALLSSTSVFLVTTAFFALVLEDAAGKEASALRPALVDDLVARPMLCFLPEP